MSQRKKSRQNESNLSHQIQNGFRYLGTYARPTVIINIPLDYGEATIRK